MTDAAADIPAKRGAPPPAPEGPELVTERLLLRLHRACDLDAILALHAHPDVARGLSGVAPSREECWHRLLRYAGHWALFGFGLWAVCDRRTGAFLGEAGLAFFGRELGAGFDTAPEAAWIFHPDAQGRGLAAEAMVAATAWLEQRRGPERTVCIIRPENAPSLRLGSRLGYRAYAACTYKHAPFTMLERHPA